VLASDAAAAWARLGCPYERALALQHGHEASLREALAEFEQMGASASAVLCRERLHAMGARGVKRRTRSKTVANPAGLTTRELQVLELLTQGLSNADIARKLVRSEKTVDHHVLAALDKLAVRSRSEAAPRPRIAWGSPGRADCSRLPPMNASRSTSSMAEIEKLLGRHASLRSRRGPCRGVRQCRSRCWLRTR
jgi:DNA-binding CsgD family transcriptional regulator